MKKIRIVFIWLVGFAIVFVVIASSVRNIYMSPDGGSKRLGVLTGPIKFAAELPSTVKQVFATKEFYVPNSNSKDGINYLDESSKIYYPKLLASYKEEAFGQRFELLDLKTQKSIKKWSPDNVELYQLSLNDKNPYRPKEGSDLYFMHPYMTKDSSLVINSQLTSLITKINTNDEIDWYKNDRVFHHTIEPLGKNKLLVCSRPFESGKYDFLPGNYDEYKSVLLDDHITILNESDGKELYSKSIIEILVENGFKDLLLGKGQVISDPIHLNDIQPATYKTDYWDVGDLLISCRNLSTVFLYRPSTNTILWLKQHPWYNQHDVDFKEEEIVIFGNDILREESSIDPKLTSSNLSFSEERPHNQIYIYNFEKDSVYTPYTDLMKNEKIRTITSGRSEILSNGDIFIEETNQGRIIIGDSTHKKMEYVKRLDKEYISSLFWSRIIN